MAHLHYETTNTPKPLQTKYRSKPRDRYIGKICEWLINNLASEGYQNYMHDKMKYGHEKITQEIHKEKLGTAKWRSQ